MYLEKSTLSIRLTEPVVPVRSTSRRASRHHDTDSEVLPPAIVRGLLTLTLAKPAKVSSIELGLQAKATTRYAQGAGPGRVDVTEEYKVHSTSTVIFKAGLVHQVRQRATPTQPRVQFRDDHTASDAQYGIRPVARSADIDPRSPVARRRLSSEDLENDDGRNSEHDHTSVDPAPPYCRSAGQLSSADLYPPTTSRSHSVASSSGITEPQNSPIPSLSNLTPDIPCGSPTTSVHSIHDLALSRTSSFEEPPEDDNEILDASVPHPGNVAYYGLSRIAIGSSGCSSERGRSGRSHSRFSLGKVVHVFDMVKDHVRSQSPRAGSRPRSDEQEVERGRSLTKGKARAQVSTHGVGLALPQIGAAETSVAGGANDRNGDDWVVFPEGTYTYPIFFMIPNNSPPTMKADHGSLIWKIKAEVKRPGAFKAKMTAQKEVIVVSLPNADNLEVEELDLQRQWDGQFKYRVQIAGRGFPIGGKLPFQLTIMPLAKIKVHCIYVYLDERTEYYTRAETQARSDAIRRATLLVIKHNNFDTRYGEPILPLVSNEPHAFRKSPLHRFLRPGEDESEVASSFVGPGPWTIRHQLRVPDSCSILHPSNRAKGSNVMVDHTLKIVLRVEKEETTVIAGRKKLYDIVIHTPIRILSCRCTPEWMSLPRYDEALRSEGDPPEDTSCPCRTRRQAKARAHSHATTVPLHRATSLPTTNLNTSGDLGIFSLDSPASRTHLHELLMSGLVSERGEAPPSYYERFGAVCV